MSERAVFAPFCPHGLATYMACGQCEENRYRNRMDERSIAAFEALNATLSRLADAIEKESACDR